MATPEQLAQAERTLAGAYPAAVGFDIRDEADATIQVYDELVARGRADALTEAEDPQFAGKRAYRLSSAAADELRKRADEADLN